MSGDRQPILDVNQAFYRAFEKRDLEAMSLVWSQGTGSLCVHPGWEILRGWDAIRTSWAQIFRNTQYVEIDLDIVTVEVSSPLAYVVLVENVLQVGSGRKIRAQSIATNIFESMGGQWYLISHHASPVLR